MACGLPVVASNVGGLSDFVKGEVGTLVHVDDPDELCGAVIKEIFDAKAPADRKSAIARYAFEHYSQTNFIHELVETYGVIANKV
jgi:glycosyltransferase involved in cell wall biosynthesis